MSYEGKIALLYAIMFVAMIGSIAALYLYSPWPLIIWFVAFIFCMFKV